MNKIKIIIVLLCFIIANTAFASKRSVGELAYDKKDYQQAFTYFSNALTRDPNDLEAHKYLGLLYLDGLGTAKNLSKAFEHIQIAANCDNPNIRALLASLYLNGDGVEKNYRLAYIHAKLSAENNCAYGQLLLGIMYYNGLGTTKNYSEAFNYIFSSATNIPEDDSRSQIFLATLYENGDGVKRNLKEAYKWYLIGKANIANDKKPADWSQIFKPDSDMNDWFLDPDRKIEKLEKHLTKEEIKTTQIEAKNWMDAYSQKLTEWINNNPSRIIRHGDS